MIDCEVDPNGSLRGFLCDLWERHTRMEVDALTQAAHQALIQEALDLYETGDIQPRVRGVTFEKHKSEIYALVGDDPSNDNYLTRAYIIKSCPTALL